MVSPRIALPFTAPSSPPPETGSWSKEIILKLITFRQQGAVKTGVLRDDASIVRVAPGRRVCWR
jgi:hypothetical protein